MRTQIVHQLGFRRLDQRQAFRWLHGAGSDINEKNEGWPGGEICQCMSRAQNINFNSVRCAFRRGGS